MHSQRNAGTGEAAVCVRDLAKRFQDVIAVDGVDFDIGRGELFGLLGPNGAGKTTTINLLTGLAKPDRGRINIAGVDAVSNPKAAQHLIGVVPDESNLYPELSGRDNLRFCGALYGMRKRHRDARARELLSRFGLEEAAERSFSTYSKGMKRKLTIAAGIVHNPSILFLDEPTTGIDVASARQIRQLIADLYHSGTTILLTTHYIEEAERLCQRIAFIVHGKIVKLDTLEALLQPVKGQHIVQVLLSDNALPPTEELRRVFHDVTLESTGPGALRLSASSPLQIGPLVNLLERHSLQILEMRTVRLSLEDVFVDVTGIERTAMNAGQVEGGQST